MSQHGADYDADAWGVIRYCVKTAANSCGNLSATSEVTGNVTVTTDLVFTAASGSHGFGYIISGTTRDGAHYHSGGSGFNYTYVAPDGTSTVECNNCDALQAATSRTYTPSATPSAGVLPDPLLVAAKYGAFTDSNGNDLPDVQSEWDSKLANGVPGQDGMPDNYFLVTNPLGLEAALDRAFITILSNASASSVATNSTSLQTGTHDLPGALQRQRLERPGAGVPGRHRTAAMSTNRGLGRGAGHQRAGFRQRAHRADLQHRLRPCATASPSAGR